MEYKKVVRAIMSNRSLTIESQINFIKQSVDAGEFKDALKLNPIYYKFLNKSPFFKNIEDIYPKDPFQFTKDFKKEFRWITNLLENYFVEINSFILYKNEFEKHFVLNQYDQAIANLEKIEGIFGISIWSIEANLCIQEKINGSESNWNTLSKFLTKIDNSIYDFVINSSSKRFEQKLSYESYINQFQNDIDNVKAEGLIKDFFVFKNFNLANYDYEFKNLESVLFVSNILSVTDQYLILIDVILYGISLTTNNDKIFFNFINKAKTAINNDCRIINIYNILNEKKEIITFDKNLDVFKCLNSYYSGNFNLSLELAVIGIHKNPTEYEYYEIYCKSLINLELSFTSLNLSETVDELLLETYNLLSFKKDKSDCYKKLLKLSLFFMNFNMGKQIYSLLSEVEDIADRHFVTGVLSSSFNSYKNLYLAKKRPSILAGFGQLMQEHSFKVYYYKLGKEITFDNNISLSNLQLITIKAIHSYENDQFDDVVEILKQSYELINSKYYVERKYSLLFNSYLFLNRIEDALLLFGKIYFDDSIITRKLNHHKLFENINKGSKKDDFVSLIEYPILYSLVVKEYDLYEVFDDFICATEVLNILDIDIDEFIIKFSLKKVIYFLNNVATIDTIKYSTDYGSISEVEEDRIKILKILVAIDGNNKLLYEKEMNEIYRINSVRKVLKEVDEGRLYIDVNSLKEIQVKKFNDDFTRFKEIEISSVGQPLIAFNPANAKNWERLLTEKNDTNEKYNSADYLAFKSIYLESRENFLFSKEYGLDSCLSTRIRHGALKNHLRSVFEKLDLVTSKTKNSYADNDTWQHQLFYFPEINVEAQRILKEFSKKIDNYAIYIVDKLIQIQTEKTVGKDDALFSFFTNDEVLFRFYNHNKHLFNSIGSVVDIILSSLTNRALIDLQLSLVDFFNEVILRKYQEIIDFATVELRSLNLPYECQLIPNFIKSSTNIQIEIDNISNWFYLNTTNSTTLLSIETVLDASVELTNKINPNYKIKPVINLQCEPFGVYSSLVFVFNILFNNIIEHSHLEFENVFIQIDIESIDEEYNTIRVTNNVSSFYSFDDDVVKLSKIKENWNDHSNIERSNKEGESGFDKIKRILLYETYSKTDKFDFFIEGNSISIVLYFPYVKYN